MDTGWGEALEQVDQKHADAHKRIRDDLERTAETCRTLAARLESNYNYFVLQQGALQRGIDEAKALATRPVEGTTVVWGTKTVIAVIAAVSIGVGMYIDLRQGNKDLRRDLSDSTTAFSKAITEIREQRDRDKRDADSRLNQFLNQRLETSLAVAAAGKGAKK